MKVKKVSNLNLLDMCAMLVHVSRTLQEMNRYYIGGTKEILR